jgi:hypothetical protein
MAARSLTPEERAQFNAKLERVYVLIAKLADSNDNTRSIAAGKLASALSDVGVDFHAVVECARESLFRIAIGEERKSWLSDKDKALFRAQLAEAKEAGKREAMLLGSANRSDDFQRTDGRTDWREIARYVDRERHRLTGRYADDWWNELITNIATLAMSSYPITLSEKRERKLLEVFARLGGKIT